jgi:hypothetical protein
MRYPIGTPGVRTRQVTVVTTLLDPERDPVTDRAERSRQRRQIETSLAHLKTTLQMDVLHGQTVTGSGSASWMPSGGPTRQVLARHSWSWSCTPPAPIVWSRGSRSGASKVSRS